MRPTITERLLAKTKRTPGGCWEWTGSTNRHGYGQFGIGRKNHHAHRVAYELMVGPIPEGLVLDHLCRNRACVNPAHLEAVTNAENVRRGYSAKTKRWLDDYDFGLQSALEFIRQEELHRYIVDEAVAA